MIAKGDIVLAGSICGNKSKTADLSIRVMPQMVPKARLVVYHMRTDNHEIVADMVSFEVEYAYQTPVHLSSNVTEAAPAAQVDLQVSTNPSAFVALLGVDQSALLLGSGDITKDDVQRELLSYDRKDSSHGGYQWRGCTPPIYGSGASAAEIFDNAGLIIFTNGIVYRADIYRRQFYPSNYSPRLFYAFIIFYFLSILPTTIMHYMNLLGMQYLCLYLLHKSKFLPFLLTSSLF